MKNPASSTENFNPGFAKSTQGLCVRGSGRRFLSGSRAFSFLGYLLRSMPRFTIPQVHKMTSAVTRGPILSTAAVILSASRAILWPSDAILPTGRVILRTVSAILCTVGAILRGFCDILRAAPCSAVAFERSEKACRRQPRRGEGEAEATDSATPPSQAEDAPEFPEIAETHSAIRATTRALLRTRPHKAVPALVPRSATALQVRLSPLSLNN